MMQGWPAVHTPPMHTSGSFWWLPLQASSPGLVHLHPTVPTAPVPASRAHPVPAPESLAPSMLPSCAPASGTTVPSDEHPPSPAPHTAATPNANTAPTAPARLPLVIVAQQKSTFSVRARPVSGSVRT